MADSATRLAESDRAPAGGVPLPLLAGHPAADGLLSSDHVRQLVAGFVVLGLFARCVRYFLNFPLWEDECFLCVNFIDRSFAGLLDPLDYHQVAPPLFLWIERAAVKAFGFSEHVLRAFPFVCGVASLFVFTDLARKLLRGPALVFAVALFAVSYPGIRYGGEAKQYASDLLTSLVLVRLAVAAWGAPGSQRATWALAGFAPFAVWLSYPAAFVGGAISLFLLAVLVTQRRPRAAWVAWATFNVLLVAGFVSVFLIVARTQGGAERQFMERFWERAFPPWTAPLQLPVWLLATHTGDLMAIPVGGQNGASLATCVGFVAGVTLLARKRRRMGLLFSLAPFVLHLAAAALRRYPYGGHVKFSQHLAPMICLLTGLGSTVWFGFLRNRPLATRALLATLLLAPGLIGLTTVARDVLHPRKTASDLRARAFAQWFWFSAESEGEVVCLKSDLDQDFSPQTWRQLSWSAMYLCNREIYSPRRRAGRALQLAEVSASRPLRCVLYRDPNFSFDQAAFDAWLERQQESYRLVGRETWPFPRYDKSERKPLTVDSLEEFKFVPRESPQPERTAARNDVDATMPRNATAVVP